MASTMRQFSRARGQESTEHSSWLRLWLVLVLLALVLFALACSRGIRYANEEPVEPDEGLYPQGVFYYQATALNQKLSGRLVIVDTLVILEPENDRCLLERAGTGRIDSRTFSCDGAPTASGVISGAGVTTLIHINLRRPTRDSHWRRLAVTGTSGTNAAQGRVCVQGHQDRGRFVCDRYEYQSRVNTGWQTGRLQVRRAPFPSADTTTAAASPREREAGATTRAGSRSSTRPVPTT